MSSIIYFLGNNNYCFYFICIVEIKYDIKKLMDKFEKNDNSDAYQYFNLLDLFKKIEFYGFKSLSFDELSFLHKTIIKHSTRLCLKYLPIIYYIIENTISFIIKCLIDSSTKSF